MMELQDFVSVKSQVSHSAQAAVWRAEVWESYKEGAAVVKLIGGGEDVE